MTARFAGRDPATNIAILRPAEPIAAPSIAAGEAHTGAVALAIGADGTGGASARLGLVNLAGAEWHSSRGGLIDRRIVLDLRLARREEGGPVFDAAGACLGMSTFGPRGQVIAIPTATIERIVPLLLKDGRIARGWLGVALQAVAVPDALRETAGQSSGLMVMSVVEDGPAAQARIVAGDIILSVDGTSTHRLRKIARHFGSDSIGRKADLRLIRSGAVITVQSDHRRTARRMREAAGKLAPTMRLRVAVHAIDLPRRTALGRMVAEAGHMVVGTEDAADVVLADGDCPPGETRPVITLGGAGDDLPGVLSRDADARPDRCRHPRGFRRPDRPLA